MLAFIEEKIWIMSHRICIYVANALNVNQLHILIIIFLLYNKDVLVTVTDMTVVVL